MSRLQSEWRRLYLPQAPASAETAFQDTSLIDPDGRVRAMVLELGKPADWAALSPVWQAVQAELKLPAPAIAVSGLDGYQLWFSLAQAVPVHDARTFLTSLCRRYLADIAPHRIGLLPADRADTAQTTWHVGAGTTPGQEVLTDQWSAFLAPDLAPMFTDSPWLDIPPSAEGQADLLSRLQSIKLSDWQTALAQLQAGQATQAAEPASTSAPSTQASIGPTSNLPCIDDPRRFLLNVMNDGSIALNLRIEAAKALLPYTQPGN